MHNQLLSLQGNFFTLLLTTANILTHIACITRRKIDLANNFHFSGLGNATGSLKKQVKEKAKKKGEVANDPSSPLHTCESAMRHGSKG
jgi:hypothetical protein